MKIFRQINVVKNRVSDSVIVLFFFVEIFRETNLSFKNHEIDLISRILQEFGVLLRKNFRQMNLT